MNPVVATKGPTKCKIHNQKSRSNNMNTKSSNSWTQMQQSQHKHKSHKINTKSHNTNPQMAFCICAVDFAFGLTIQGHPRDPLLSGYFPQRGLSVALLSLLSCYLSKCFLQAPHSSLGHVVELVPCYVHGVLFSHTLTIVNLLETICQTWEGGEPGKGEKQLYQGCDVAPGTDPYTKEIC